MQPLVEKEDANQKFEAVEKYKVKLQEDFIGFGELLSDIKRKGTYRAKGYKNFKDFIETEYNLASSFAGKLIDIYELYIEELDMDEESLKEIGFDRLSMIKPFVKDSEISVAEAWIEEAKEKSTPELRNAIKEEKEKTKKSKTFKEIFTEQHIERMVTFFNCNVKELNFKMAVFFQDEDLESIKQSIKDKQRRMEMSGDFTGMFNPNE